MIMKKKIIKGIEKRCVNYLYTNNFMLFGRINKKAKKIIFNWDGIPIFNMFTGKKNFVLWFLIRFYGYQVYEQRLCLFLPYKAKITHTKGEVLDIIWSYKKIRIRPFPLSHVVEPPTL